MTNLTASEARRLIDKLHHNQTKEHGISILEEKYLCALEIALSVLEQQEVKSILLSDYKCDDDLVYPMYECSECQLRHLPEERRPSQQVGQTKCPRCECAHFKRHIIDHRDPDERPTDTYQQIENDGWIDWGGGACKLPGNSDVEIRQRGGRVIRCKADMHTWWWRGGAYDIIAYRVIENDGREG